MVWAESAWLLWREARSTKFPRHAQLQPAAARRRRGRAARAGDEPAHILRPRMYRHAQARERSAMRSKPAAAPAGISASPRSLPEGRRGRAELGRSAAPQRHVDGWPGSIARFVTTLCVRHSHQRHRTRPGTWPLPARPSHRRHRQPRRSQGGHSRDQSTEMTLERAPQYKGAARQRQRF